MYAWIWRRLPGAGAVRVLSAVGLAVAVLAVLLLVVFPGLDALLPYTDVDVGR